MLLTDGVERIDPNPNINVKRFRGGLVFKAHRRLDHSTVGLRVIKKKNLLLADGIELVIRARRV